MSGRVRNVVADVLVVLALVLLGLWLLRRVVGFVGALFGLVVLAAVVVGLLALSGRIRKGGGGPT